MVIARGEGKAEGSQLLLLGLSRENVRRLENGEPIYIKRATHGDGIPEGWEIVILYGETELDLQALLERAGVLGTETKIHIDPRLGSA